MPGKQAKILSLDDVKDLLTGSRDSSSAPSVQTMFWFLTGVGSIAFPNKCGNT